MGIEVSFVSRIRELRGERTQQEMASMLGILKSKWCRWEKGQHEPSIKDLVAICRIFSVQPAWLIGFSGEGGTRQAAGSGGCPSCRDKDATILALAETIASQQRTIAMLAGQNEKKMPSSEALLPPSGAGKRKKTA